MELLKQFDPAELRVIVQSVNQLGTMNSDDLEEIVKEFEASFEQGEKVLGSASEIRGLVEEAIGADQLAAALSPPEVTREPVWPALIPLKIEILRDYIEQEHPQAAAYILSRLDSARVAELMKPFSPHQRNSMLSGMLSIGRISDVADQVVQQALRVELLGAPPEMPKFHNTVANILNQLDREQSIEAMQYLSETRPDDAKVVKRLLFKFEDLLSLPPKSLAALVDRIPVEQMVIALKGINPSFQAGILAVMSPRSKRMAESELQSGSGGSPRESQEVRQQIAVTVLKLASEGIITLAEDDADGDAAE
jgi:flagellar motor switch protein FliG